MNRVPRGHKPPGWLRTVITMLFVWRRFGSGINQPALVNVAVLPKLGLVFNRIKKNANTTAIILLRELETGTEETPSQAKRNAPVFFNLPFRDLTRLDEFHSFAIIRNPYSRVLSAFLEKFRKDKYRAKHGSFTLDRDGFRDFVIWLGQGGLKKNKHWDLQHKLLMMPLERFDTIIRFENFAEEMTAFFSARGIQAPPERLRGLYPSDKGKQTSSSSKLAQFYTPEVRDLVAELYREDFLALGYDFQFPVELEESPPDRL